MRSSKRYSNVTFTKRVDHDRGEHRPPRSAAEPLVCQYCGATYRRRRWVLAGTIVRAKKNAGGWVPPRTTVCPGCARARSGVPSGYLHLSGGFFAAHRADVDRLLRNEAERAAEDNPLARVMGRERPHPGELTLTTTTEHLAQRLGHALEKAFGGDVRYDFSHENKVARVDWKRD